MSNNINITFLGTGQAVPTAKRNHTSILMHYKNETILFDCGEGTQRQFRIAKQNPCKLTRLIITHWHGDHILGIPGLLQTLLLNNYRKPLYIYGPKGTAYFMNQILKIFVPYNKIPINIKEIIKGKVIETEDFCIESLPMSHGIPCNAYSFIEKDKLRLDKEKLKKLNLPSSPLIAELQKGKNIKTDGKLIKASSITYKVKGRKIAIIMDTAINDNCYKISKNSDLLISEAVYTNKERELAKLHEHLTAEQAGQIAKKSGSKKLIISHLSQRYDCNEKSILKETCSKFKNSEIAHDLMQIEI